MMGRSARTLQALPWPNGLFELSDAYVRAFGGIRNVFIVHQAFGTLALTVIGIAVIRNWRRIDQFWTARTGARLGNLIAAGGMLLLAWAMFSLVASVAVLALTR
jgi:hypothetical protein